MTTEQKKDWEEKRKFIDRWIGLFNDDNLGTLERMADYHVKELKQAHQEDMAKVREMVEGMKLAELDIWLKNNHYGDCEVKTGKSMKGECGCGLRLMHAKSYNQALDDLLSKLESL